MLLRPRNVAALVLFFIASWILFGRLSLRPTSPWHYLATSGKASPDILNATLGFQSIFVINLASRTDRRDAMTLASAVTGLDITWVDGVAGSDVPGKVLPGGSAPIGAGNKGSWRAHMNVLQRVIQANLTSALILEDDADWDLRLKSQLQLFALAARAFTQPLRHNNGRPLSSQPNIINPPSSSTSSPARPVPPSIPLTHLHSHYPIPSPKLTPYGDAWDVLWLGHCGTSLPSSALPVTNKNTRSSNNLVVTISSDPTVPPPAHLKPHPFALQEPLATLYPPHTRVVHLSNGTTCTQAYAVSQQGARKLLYQFGLAERLTKGWDLLLGDWCDGLFPLLNDDNTGTSGDGAGRPVCVTVQPPLFSHHFGTGGAGRSDISAPGGGFLRVAEGAGGEGRRAMTPYVRWSVRLNMARLLGKGGQASEGVVVDQWADVEDGSQ